MLYADEIHAEVANLDGMAVIANFDFYWQLRENVFGYLS